MDYNDILLMEDNVTKFGGKVFPKFGWCCILAGGPGSGKGYNFDRYIPIQGRKFDVDEVKSYYIKKMRVVQSDISGNLVVYTDGNNKEHTIDLDDAGINPPYNTSNPQFTGLLHQVAKPLTKKLKSLIFNGNAYSENGRLPNVIFDCTMSDVKDYEILIPEMKGMGYRIAIVYILTPIETAINQNRTRGMKNVYDDEGNVVEYGRRVDYGLLLNNHEGVYRSLTAVSDRTDLIKDVDDVWALIQAGYDNPPVLLSIKGEGDTLDLSSIDKFIDLNTNNISNLITKYNKSNNKYSYNESATGAIGLYEALKELNMLEE